jgi:type IV pilus assembly protein PilN
VEDLQTDRNTPVRLLDELVKQTPEGVYLTSIKQTDKVVQVTGIAQTNERVSEFLRNTLYSSPWLERPELIEIKAAKVSAGDGREQRRLNEFSMRLNLKQPPSPDNAASAAAPTARPARTP